MEQLLTTILTWFEQVRLSHWGVAYIVLIIPIAVSFFFNLNLHKEIFVVSLRAVLQLLLIALVLLPVFSSHWSIQVLLVMVILVMGAIVAGERGKGIPKAFLIALSAMVPGYGIIMGIFVVTRSLELMPNIIIPISGMLIGNASRTISLCYHKTKSDFITYQSAIEALMLDGAEYSQALRLPSQITLKNALVPRIDALKTLGIVHIPGAMAGMMIAGASPLESAGYQILIFFGIVSISAIASIIANYFSYRVLFRAAYPHLNFRGLTGRRSPRR